MVGASGADGPPEANRRQIDRPIKADCVCRAAVVRAYGSLTAAGVPAGYALDAAVRVYRFHHPEELTDRARALVERWVLAGPVH